MGRASARYAEGPGLNPSECHIFLFFPLRSFFLCYPGEALEGPISTGVSKDLNNVDSNNSIQLTKKYYTKEIESTVDIHRKKYYIYIVIEASHYNTLI